MLVTRGTAKAMKAMTINRAIPPFSLPATTVRASPWRLTMTEAQSKAAKRRYARDAEDICPHCGGSGRIMAKAMATRSRKGGNQSYLNSMKPGQLEPSELGSQ